MSILHSFLFIRLAFFVCFLVVPFSVQSEDWSQWRGVERDGNWDVTGIIDHFPDDGPRLRWVASLGSGYSGPSVAKGKVFVMDRLVKPLDSDGAKLLHEGKPPRNINFVRKLLPGSERIVCLNEKDGSLLWSYKWDCDYTSVAAYAIGPRVTPTVDDSRVYSLGAEGNLFCHNVNNGEVIWSRDFKKDYALKTPEWGVSAHPLVYENKLICVVGGEGSTVVAFDKYKYRLGYGGGYYDRTFIQLKKIDHPFISVGLAYDDQKINKVSKDYNDQKIDYILTEKRLYTIK